jgi:hypothetical protein
MEKHNKENNDILLGISMYTGNIDENEETVLRNRFSSSVDKCCELCGVSLHEKIRHPLLINKEWHNACGMCFYSANLDRIPSFNNGTIIYFPFLSQSRLNSLLRCIWAMEEMSKLDPDNDELSAMCDSMEEVSTVIKGQIGMTEAYFNNTDTEVYASTLGLITKEEYDQRHKLLLNFRWVPDKRIFEDDLSFWLDKDLKYLHNDQVKDYMLSFMNEFVPTFSLKNDD